MDLRIRRYHSHCSSKTKRELKTFNQTFHPDLLTSWRHSNMQPLDRKIEGPRFITHSVTIKTIIKHHITAWCTAHLCISLIFLFKQPFEYNNKSTMSLQPQGAAVKACTAPCTALLNYQCLQTEKSSRQFTTVIQQAWNTQSSGYLCFLCWQKHCLHGQRPLAVGQSQRHLQHSSSLSRFSGVVCAVQMKSPALPHSLNLPKASS